MTYTLKRYEEGKIISGVCAGFGHYFMVDTSVIRLAFIVLSLINFLTPVFYITCVMIMGSDQETDHSKISTDTDKFLYTVISISIICIIVIFEILNIPFFVLSLNIPFLMTISLQLLCLLSMIIYLIVKHRFSFFKRNMQNKMFLGIFSGISEQTSVDVTILRLGFVALNLIFGFKGFCFASIYILAGIILEEESA